MKGLASPPFNFTGTITQIHEDEYRRTSSGTPLAFKKFHVVEDGLHMSKAVRFTCRNKQTLLLNNIEVGTRVTVYFNLEGSFNKAMHFNNLYVSKIEKL